MSVLARFTWFGASVVMLSCAADPQATESDIQDVINAPLPGNLDLILHSKSTVTIGPFSQVDGDVGSTGANGSVLFDVGSSQGFFFSNRNTLASTVTVRAQASAGHVFGNSITVDGFATATSLGFDPATLPPVPAGAPVTPGTRAVSLVANQRKQLCPGQYGAISLASGATLNLNGGVYQVTRLTLADGARLEPSEPVVILVTGGLTTGTSAAIVPSAQALNPMTAGDIRIEVGGAITLGDNTTVRAHLLAPNGKLTASNNVRLTGAAWAKAIALGTSDIVVGEGTFSPQAAAVPPPCNDNSACTLDACVTSGTTAFCTNTPVPAGTSCEDGDICNGTEACSAAGVCEHSSQLPPGSSCSDGNACNGIETCSASATCAPGVPPIFDGGVCTLEHCGDGILDPGEQCDDGNIDDFDGCSNLCALQFGELEPNEDGSPSIGNSDFATANADANGAFADSVLVRAQLSPAGDEDVFAFENTTASPRTVQFDVWDATAGIGVSCNQIDPTLAIRTSAGDFLAFSDDFHGLCPSLSFTLAPGQRVYASVVEFSDFFAIPGYLLVATYQ